MPFTFSRTKIPDVILIGLKAFSDDRGSFAEIFKSSEFKSQGISGEFAQCNLSRSRKNVLRGLHYQKDPAAQGKLVLAVRGEIFDVAVDIRKGSPTYGQSVTQNLSDRERNMLYIPPGFAHGFSALSDEAEVIYFCSREYSPEHERTILWNDPQLNISWPVACPLLSPKDAQGKLLSEAENNFEYGR